MGNILNNTVVELGNYIGGVGLDSYIVGVDVREKAMLGELEKCSKRITLIIDRNMPSMNEEFICGLFNDIESYEELTKKYSLVGSTDIINSIRLFLDNDIVA